MANPRVDIYQPIIADRQCSPPLELRVGVPNATWISEGVPMASVRPERYVLLSCLPEELRQRVELAIQVLAAGG